MSKEQNQLKLGKGTIFVKSRIKRLPQEDETWEADFRALPKPPMQSVTEYMGLVVTEPDGFLLADTKVPPHQNLWVNSGSGSLARL